MAVKLEDGLSDLKMLKMLKMLEMILPTSEGDYYAKIPQCFKGMLIMESSDSARRTIILWRRSETLR